MSTVKINHNHYSPAHPTFPVQDKFNQVIMAAGLNKLEMISALILGHHLNNPNNQNFELEILVNDSIDIAEMLLNSIEKRLNENQNTIETI